jgi:hypothetical protein
VVFVSGLRQNVIAPNFFIFFAGLFRKSEGPLQKLRLEPAISLAVSGSPSTEAMDEKKLSLLLEATPSVR